MIYRTPFNPDTMTCTESSVVTAFDSLDDAVVQHGIPVKRTASYAVYHGVIFSRVCWHIEPEEVSFL